MCCKVAAIKMICDNAKFHTKYVQEGAANYGQAFRKGENVNQH